MKILKIPSVDREESLRNLIRQYRNKGWKEKDLVKFWVLAHKIEGLASDLVPMTYKVKAILRKFLNEIATDDLPQVIRFAIQNEDYLTWKIKNYNGSLVSFCFNYGKIYRRFKDEE